jgi:hypothetical protein
VASATAAAMGTLTPMPCIPPRRPRGYPARRPCWWPTSRRWTTPAS